MVPEVRDRSYENRLAALNLWTLEERRNRAELIELFRMKQGISGLVFEDYIELDCSGRARGHSCKLRKDRSNRDLRRCFFSQRVVNRWNKLGERHCFCDILKFVQEWIRREEKGWTCSRTDGLLWVLELSQPGEASPGKWPGKYFRLRVNFRGCWRRLTYIGVAIFYLIYIHALGKTKTFLSPVGSLPPSPRLDGRGDP